MSEAASSYAVVMTGEITEGEALVDVKHNVAMLFNVVGPKLDKLFSGKPVAVRRNVNQDQAREICAILLDAGVIAKVRSEGADEEEEVASSSATVVDLQSGQVVSEQVDAKPAANPSLDLGCPHCGEKIEVQFLKPEQAEPTATARITAAPLERTTISVPEQPVANAEVNLEVVELVGDDLVAQTELPAESVEEATADFEPVADQSANEEITAEVEQPAAEESAMEVQEASIEESLAPNEEEIVAASPHADETATAESTAPVVEEPAVEVAVEPAEKIVEHYIEESVATAQEMVAEAPQEPAPEPAAPTLSLEGFEPDLECPRCAHEQPFTQQCGLCRMDLRLHIKRLHRKERVRAWHRKMRAPESSQ